MPQNEQKRDAKPGGETQLQGWPGYRTRDNRSGLDPIDSRAEAAHMGGTFFYNLFTLRLRSRNPFYLLLMFLFGVVPFSTLAVLIFSTIVSENPSSWSSLIFPFLALIITGALAISFVLSVLQIAGLISSPKSAKSSQQNVKKKRKDHK
jgi:TRAP-type C4-dicarboxylate transport system permease small subunit